MILVNVVCQDVDNCQAKNPIYNCYLTANQQILAARENVPQYCRAVKTYINCTETVACGCQLGHSALVLQQITQYSHLYSYYNCSTVLNEDLITNPGITCPGQQPTGSDTNAGLLVLALDTLENVGVLDGLCSGIRKCYKKLSDAGGIALFNKDLRAYCSAIEEFLPCFESTTCGCGQTKDSKFTMTVHNERLAYNTVCTVITKGVFYKDGIECSGDAPLDVCKQQNPIYQCFDAFAKASSPDPSFAPKVCPAFKQYLSCTEGTACKCGLKTSVPVLQGLTFAHKNYETQGCAAVSGNIDIKFGINCPAGSPNSGTATDEILTSLGIMDSPLIIKAIQQCYAIGNCYKISDRTTAKALYEKNADALCQSQSDFIHCAEQAACKCNKYTDAPYQNFLVQQKTLHLSLCTSDTSITADYICDASVLQTSILSVFISVLMSIWL